MKVRYCFTEDGDTELCDAEKAIVNQDIPCYHCDAVISKGTEAIHMKSFDGDAYMIHENCFQQSCQIIAID